MDAVAARAFARDAVKAGAAAFDRVRRPLPGIVVLIYHRVGNGGGGQMEISPNAFDEQMSWLTAHHRVMSLDDAVAELERAESRPGVVVTFDDGTTDWADHVLPALDRHGVPATFYVATEFVDKRVAFPADGNPIDWSGLRELASSRLVTIGSHTHSHALLDRLPATEVAHEIDRSVELLGEHVGVQAVHFAYPKAVAGSPTAEALVRARFRTAVLAGTRPNGPSTDLHRIARTPIQASDGDRWFRHKAAGGLRLEDDLRRAANRVRYRALQS